MWVCGIAVPWPSGQPTGRFSLSGLGSLARKLSGLERQIPERDILAKPAMRWSALNALQLGLIGAVLPADE